MQGKQAEKAFKQHSAFSRPESSKAGMSTINYQSMVEFVCLRILGYSKNTVSLCIKCRENYLKTKKIVLITNFLLDEDDIDRTLIVKFA